MIECGNCEIWEQKYDNLKYRYDNLSNKYEDVRNRLNKTEDELSDANYKVKYELEPRIQSENRSYDSYVLNGGSDECFSNGMSGNCGVECSIFGDKIECYDSFSTEEQILELYETEATTNILMELIVKMGLQEKCKDIDRKLYQEDINIHKEAIRKLEVLIK